MGTEMVVVNENMSMPECLQEMRKQAEDLDDIYNVYVVDDDGRLKGVFPLKKMITNPSVSKVKSGVISLKRNGRRSLDCNEALFRKIVKATFGMRRKMLRNSLRQFYDKDSPLPAECPYLDKRPEQLSVEDFIKLTLMVEGKA